MSKVRVNYKSDLPPIEVKFKIDGEDVNVPDHDFSIRFFVDGMPGISFVCGYKDGEFINCEKTAIDTLTCYIDNHGFGCGRLCCEYIDLAKSNKYSDGIRKTVTPNRLDIILVEGEGDDIVSITSSVVIDIAALIADMEAALEEMEGYADIVAALQVAVATIPSVIDDLETGGHTDALSAEQGKLLKILIDELGRISIDGIKRFTPISSLDELPLNPTTEQKRQAYLFENTLYVYVGAGGDTLDGKYQSVELVSLDWGDKSYNASEFSGLGRRWLKKNIASNKNVLTAAMIGTANTEYFIQYDYDLDGATVALPANASLVFMGGSIKNGILVGNNTRIQAKKGVMIFDNITIQGTWDVAEAYSSWFKTYKAGYRIASITEDVITLRRGTDGNYYEMEELTLKSGKYYVTSTLVDGQVVESSIQVIITTYQTFRVEGDDTDYLAEAAEPTDVFEEAGYPWFDGSSYAEYDDTAALQSLLDLRAKRAIIEEGTYMIKANSKTSEGQNVGLYYDLQNDNELVIDGWLKAIQNVLGGYHLLDVIDCNNIKITGKGGVEGDLAEHLIRGNSQYGMCLSVSGTNGLIVEGLTFAYAWGDCVYNHAWSHGRSSLGSGKTQSNHLYHNVKFLWGRRTGYVGERGNDVTIDSCYFYGCGKLRAVDLGGTFAAIDLEPPSRDDSLFAYVRGYTFKNNYFEHNRLGLRTERGINVSIYDNYFEDVTNEAIYVVNHQYAREKDTTAPGGNKYTLPIMRIFNNNVRTAGIGISIAYNNVVNAEIYGNMLVSCNLPIYVGYGKVENCNIYNNSMYGCGTWYINTSTFKNCDIYNNKSYGNGIQAGSDLIYIRDTTFPAKSIGTKIHDNYFSHDYNKSIYGLGEYGTESFYHGLFPYSNKKVTTQNLLDPTSAIEVYNNYVSDDIFLPWGLLASATGLNSVRTESSEVFLIGDTFKSSYGDEGVVTAGYIKSCSWITDEETGATPFVANMDVELGQIVSIVESSTTYYKMCTQAGTCGDSLSKNDTTSGTAGFLNAPFTDSVIGTLAIDYKTRGTCTSSTRPTTFNFKGRRMFETDTCKELLYDGSDWLEITTN